MVYPERRSALSRTGVCPWCQLRVPVLRDGTPARHWPVVTGGRARRLRMAVPRRLGRGHGLAAVAVCAGSEITVAGLIMTTN